MTQSKFSGKYRNFRGPISCPNSEKGGKMKDFAIKCNPIINCNLHIRSFCIDFDDYRIVRAFNITIESAHRNDTNPDHGSLPSRKSFNNPVLIIIIPSIILITIIVLIKDSGGAWTE